MALKANPLVSSVSEGAMLRFFPTANGVRKFGAAAAVTVLAAGTPVAYDKVNDYWRPWGAAVSEVKTITIDATGGTFTVTVDGETTAAIAFNATAAALQTALELLSNVQAGDIVCTGGPGATAAYTLTFAGQYAGKTAPTVTTGAGSLTGGAGTAVVAQTTAAVEDERNIIRGFVWPEAVTLDDTDEVQGVVMLKGRFHHDDVQLPTGELQATLTAALAGGDDSLIAKGLMVEGTANIR